MPLPALQGPWCSSFSPRRASEHNGTCVKPQARLTRHTDLAQRLEQMPFYAIRDSGQFFLRVLQKVRRASVRLQRGIVFILFVDEEPARLGLVPVHLVHRTSRLFAG